MKFDRCGYVVSRREKQTPTERKKQMNAQFKVKFLQQLANKKANKGFTLIELLVVVIIIGVLAAIALPNLLGQVAKGRQAEAKNNLGAINRAQQGYRLEKGVFGSLSAIPVQLQPEYYSYADDQAASATGVSYTANANSTYTNDIKEYAGGAGQTTVGSFSAIICESATPSDATAGNEAAVTVTAGVVGCSGTGATEVN